MPPLTEVEKSTRPSALKSVLVIATWFFFNTSMSTVTKWTYLHGKVCTKEPGSCRPYKFPFMLTAVHMLFSWAVCSAIMWSRRDGKPGFGLRQQLRKVAPLALCFSVCVAMGNLSLKYIYPSFSQMLSSVAPLITVLVAIALRGKRFNTWTWVSMPVICGGLLVCSTEEVNFDLYGASLAVTATVLRAIKSVMQEKLLDPKEKDLDSVSLLYYLAPWAGFFLASMSLAFEGAEPLRMLLPQRDGLPTSGVSRVLALLVFSGINACFLNISGNLVTAYMGAVMLQILGNLKACFSIVVSVAIFRNPVTHKQACGVALCLFGVWLYNAKGGAVKRKVSPDAPTIEQGKQT